jgi:acetyl-CoA acetyltransferase family protein
MKERIAIINGFRSPMGKAGGVLKNLSAQQLGAIIAKETIIRSFISPNQIDEVIIGNVAQPADSANIARVIAVRAGIPHSVPAYTVHRNCASGMEAFTSACAKINNGDANIILCGGVESMSNIPLLFGKAITDIIAELTRARSIGNKLKILSKIRLKFLKPVIGLMQGLTDPLSGLIMGLTAENIASNFKITRQEQDEFALRSHLLASNAIIGNKLAEEIIPIFNYDEKNSMMIEIDEGVRKNQTIEDLSKLKPYFDKITGTVTVGNSSQITDGASMAILMSESKVRELGVEPLGFIRDFAFSGLDPAVMGLGPVFSTKKLLDKTKLKLNDFDLIEINEAFSAQVLGCVKAFASEEFCRKNFDSSAIGEIDINKLNVNGGAIALGHPVGMSGARIIIHLLRELKRRDLNTGLATLCIGGGQGGSVIVESN